MKCTLPVEFLSAYLDRELDDKERKQVEEHLKVCAYCREELKALHRVDDYVRAYEVKGPSREFIFNVNRKVMEQIAKKRRFSGFKLFPFLTPVAVAVLILIVLFNVQQPPRLIDLNDRITDYKLEKKESFIKDRDKESSSLAQKTQPTAEISEAPRAPAPAEVRAASAGITTESKQSWGREEFSTRIIEDEAIISTPSVDSLDIPAGKIVRAIVDTNGNIVKVATGNTLKPESDTLLERHLKGQQIKRPMVVGKKQQLYLDLTRRKGDRN